MADTRYDTIFDVELVAGAWKTVLVLEAPQYQRVKLLKVEVSGTGTAGDAVPIEARLTRVSKGTGSGATTVTPQPLDNGVSLAAQTVAKVDYATTEPTDDGTDPYTYYLGMHPQGALLRDLTFDRVIIGAHTAMALQLQIVSGGTVVDARGHVVHEE